MEAKKEYLTKTVSPKAVAEKYDVNSVNIEQIGLRKKINDLPIWIDESRQSNTPKIYANIFTCIEPMGEYIYFLAGDYAKDENGFLVYDDVLTSFQVDVNFEDDVIESEKSLGEDYPHIDEDLDKILQSIRDKKLESLGLYDVSVSLNHLLGKETKGDARIIFDDFSYFEFSYKEFYTPKNNDEYERVLRIKAICDDGKQDIEQVLDEFLNLIEKYKNMPYIELFGTTREMGMASRSDITIKEYKSSKKKKNTMQWFWFILALVILYQVSQNTVKTKPQNITIYKAKPNVINSADLSKIDIVCNDKTYKCDKSTSHIVTKNCNTILYEKKCTEVFETE